MIGPISNHQKGGFKLSNFDEFDSGENKTPENFENVNPVPEKNTEGDAKSGEYAYTYRSYNPPPEPVVLKKQRWLPIRTVALCLVFAIIGGLAGGAAVSLFGNRFTTSHVTITPPPVASKTSAQTGTELSAAEVYRNNVISCVSITGTASTSYFNRTVKSSISGSGFVISRDGYLVTNAHVIKDADKTSISATLFNGSTYPAEVVGYDEDNDIAVLKIAVDGLTPIKFGTSSALSVGDRVYTIGDPLGSLNYTMTSGIVSALNRIITTENSDYISTFQTDAAVNSGNSGGPIIDSFGQVVGVVTAKYSDQGVEGLGFALPIDNVIYMINDIMQYGYVKNKPLIGITVTGATKDKNGVAGAYVQTVNSGSAADKAGIKAGDVITEMDGTLISSKQDLFAVRLKHKAGDTVKVKVYRGGTTVELSLTFDAVAPKS